MKVLKIILLIVIFSSCKSFENSFKDEYKTDVLYKDQDNCYLFKPSKVSHYSSEKCFDIKYGFKEEEYQQLRFIYLSVVNDNRLIKEYQKKFNVLYSYPVKENNRLLVNSSNYGLFRVVGKVFAPNIYYLRTETNIYFYNCNDKNILIEKLNKSINIDNKLKNKISLFIDKRCDTEDGLNWNSGARFY